MTIEVKVKKLHPDAELPTKHHEDDACFDLYVLVSTLLQGTCVRKIHTGIAMEIPKGYEGVIRPRSSTFLKKEIQVHIGTIDRQYRGEIVFCANMLDPDNEYYLASGESIAQIAFRKVPDVKIIGVTELSDTDRGDGGFGSTG